MDFEIAYWSNFSSSSIAAQQKSFHYPLDIVPSSSVSSFWPPFYFIFFVCFIFFFPLYCTNSNSLKWETNWMKKVNLDSLYVSSVSLYWLAFIPDTYIYYKIKTHNSSRLEIWMHKSVFNREFFRARVFSLPHLLKFQNRV